MQTPYESSADTLSQLGEMSERQLDYDILNNPSYVDDYLAALDFDSDFILVGGDVDGLSESCWAEMPLFPPYADPPLDMDLPTDMDLSPDNDNYFSWDADLSNSSDTPTTTPELSPPVLQYPCAHCPRSFRREGEWRKHQRIHTRPITCPVVGCNGAFAQRRERDRHMESKHKPATSPTTPAQTANCNVSSSSSLHCCWTCGRGFARKDALKRHFARVHKVQVSFRAAKSGSSPTTSSSSSSFSDQPETSPRTVLSDR